MKFLFFILGVIVGVGGTLLTQKFINWLCEGMDEEDGYCSE